MCVFKNFRIVNVDVERSPVSVGPPGGGRSYANVEVLFSSTNAMGL